MNRGWRGLALGWREELRSVLDFLPLIVGSILIAVLAIATGSTPTLCFFQSPISPISPLPHESPVVPSTATPQETGATPMPTVPTMRAVPTRPDFVPWVIGLLVVIIVVLAILYWRSRREGGEGSA